MLKTRSIPLSDLIRMPWIYSSLAQNYSDFIPHNSPDSNIIIAKLKTLPVSAILTTVNIKMVTPHNKAIETLKQTSIWPLVLQEFYHRLRSQLQGFTKNSDSISEAITNYLWSILKNSAYTKGAKTGLSFSERNGSFLYEVHGSLYYQYMPVRNLSTLGQLHDKWKICVRMTIVDLNTDLLF